MISMNEMTKKLQEERAKSKAHDAVYHVLALRRRSRRIITLRGLTYRMQKEGFTNFDANDYAPVLEGLGNLGFGKLQRDPKGKVLAVYDIKTTLDSIGKAACGQGATFKSFRHKNTFKPMDTRQNPPETVAPPKVSQLIELDEHRRPRIVKTPEPPKEMLSIVVVFKGRPVTLGIPKDMNARDLVMLLGKIQSS